MFSFVLKIVNKMCLITKLIAKGAKFSAVDIVVTELHLSVLHCGNMLSVREI